MPFANTSSPDTVPNVTGFEAQTDVPPELTWRPDLRDVAGAFFTQENTVASFANEMGFRWGLYEAHQNKWAVDNDAYDPFGDPDVLGLVQDRPELANNFAFSKSPFETTMIRNRIKAEDDNRETLASAGPAGVAVMLGTGLIDPVNVLPLGFLARGLKTGRVLQGMAEAGTAGFGSSVIGEGILHATQETRTLEESMYNVGAATILSGLLGGAVALVPPGSARAMAEAFGNDIRAARQAFHAPEGGGGSGGAAAVNTSTLADETLKPTGVKAEMAGAHSVIVGNPISRLVTSPSVLVRRIARTLTETPLHFRGEASGRAAPIAVETKAKAWDGALSLAVQAMDSAFVKHRFGSRVAAGQLRAGLQDLTGRKGPNSLTYAQFKQRVAMAMRRGDSDNIPEVAEAARDMRRLLIDPLKEEAIALDLLPPNVQPKTAASYLTRVYDIEKIVAERPSFEGVIREWLAGARDEARVRDTDVLKNWEKIAENAKANMERLGPLLKAFPAEDLSKLRLDGREAAQLLRVMGREATIRERRLNTLKGMLEVAAQRRAGFKPTDKLPENDPLVVLIEAARRPVKEPMRLASWLRARGGLKEDGGELAAMDARKVLPGLVSSKGLSLDEAAEAAGNAGYLQATYNHLGEFDRPTPNDLLDALREDLGGIKRFSIEDAEQLDWIKQVQRFKEELDTLGVSLKSSNEEIAYRLGAVDDFTPDTPVQRERERQAGFYQRRLEEEIAREEAAYFPLMDRLSIVQSRANTMPGKAKALADDLFEMKREFAASRRAHERYTKVVEAERDLVDADDFELADIARQVVDKIIGQNGVGTHLPVEVNRRGALKERTLNIPDGLIENWLDNDVERVVRIYRRQMGTDVELARAFGRPDMRDQFEDIDAHYARVREGVTDPATLKKLNDRQLSDRTDLAAIRDRLKGMYAIPQDPNGLLVRGGRVVRNLNYMRLLGGATLGSLSDIGAVIARHGVGRFMNQGLRPLLTNLKNVKLSADEVRRAGTALDWVLDTRAMALADIGDEFGRHSKFERGMQWASEKFGVVNFLSPWTAIWKQFTGVMSQTRILEEVERVAMGKATAKEREHLAWLGIDPFMAGRIHDMAKSHGEAADGLRWAKTAGWTDREAVEAIRGALVKEVDTTILTPGAGDRPLWMSTEWGKVVGQFRSFTLSAMSRLTAEGLQRREWAVAQGFVAMTSLGMLSYYLKVRDRDIDWDNPATWIKEGVDRSGVTGWIFEAHNITEKLTGGLGINPLLGSAASRYADRGFVETVAGPSVGLAEDAVKRLQHIVDGKWSASDTHRMRKLLPLNNVFYLRWIFDQAEGRINQLAGIPEKAQRQKTGAE